MALVTISGKGGTGKTTIAALLVQELVRAGATTPVLAVDGDPATTLHLALGAPVPEKTLASVREQLRQDARARRTGPETEVAQVLAEAGVIVPINEQVHLLAMGQAEGRGCYCEVNAVLSTALRALLQRYNWIVIDNEAGVEHLSRVRVSSVDYFVVVVTPDRSSQVVAQRILDTARRVGVTWSRSGLVVNWDNGQPSLWVDASLPLWSVVPNDPTLRETSRMGEPVAQLGPFSPARQAIRRLVRMILDGA